MRFSDFNAAIDAVMDICNVDDDTAIETVNKICDIFDLRPQETSEELVKYIKEIFPNI